MTKERIKQIDDLASDLYDMDYERYICVVKICDRLKISVYDYFDRILYTSERSDKEPMVIIRELFPDD